MNSFTEENYLKAIFKLSADSKSGITTNAIAEKLNTKAASVTDMLKKLADKNFINYKKYQGVTLTESGKKVAVTVIRKHRLWELFLVEKLNFKWDEVHEIAEQLEHIASEELINRLERFLNYPKFDPHGDPIPDQSGKFQSPRSKKLSEILPKKACTIVGIIDHSPAFLKFLDKIGLKLGSKIQILERFDYDESVNILLNNKAAHISGLVAKNILVQDK